MKLDREDLRVRPARDSDAEFACRVIERTMRGYVERTWGRFDEAMNRRSIAAGGYEVIQHRGVDAGVLSVEPRPGYVWLARLYVRPEHQNQGIGTTIVRALMTEAAAARQPLRLRVLAVNPARRLYEREGFRVTGTTPERVYMQWTPEGVDAVRGGECPADVRALLDACGITPDLIASRFLAPEPEATELVRAETDASGREHLLAPAAADAWREMRAAAQRDGVAIRIASAFRGIERQVEIVRGKLAKGMPIEDILTKTAPPGYSEHHSGEAIDITTDGVRPFEEEFESTPAYAWLRANAGRFGFRLSYPRDNASGYVYEPWHWRFASRSSRPSA